MDCGQAMTSSARRPEGGRDSGHAPMSDCRRKSRFGVSVIAPPCSMWRKAWGMGRHIRSDSAGPCCRIGMAVSTIPTLIFAALFSRPGISRRRHAILPFGTARSQPLDAPPGRPSAPERFFHGRRTRRAKARLPISRSPVPSLPARPGINISSAVRRRHGNKPRRWLPECSATFATWWIGINLPSSASRARILPSARPSRPRMPPKSGWPCGQWLPQCGLYVRLGSRCAPWPAVSSASWTCRSPPRADIVSAKARSPTSCAVRP